MNVKPNSTPCAMLALGMGLCLPLVGAAQRSVRTQPAPDEAVVYYPARADGRWPWRGSAPVDAASGQVPDPL